jgi:MFS family permease
MRQRFREGARATLRSLEVRNFRLFFGGQMVSQIGNWLTLLAQALLVLHLTDNNGIAVGMLTACQFLPVLLLGAWAGLVADRADKRRLLLIVQSVAMFQSFVLAALAFMGDPPLVAVYAVAMFGGVATAFDNPARRAFVVEMVPETHVQNAVSLNSALMTGSRIIGPALAGLLIITVGYGWCFAIDGISYVAVLYGLWRMNPAQLHRPPRAEQARGQVRAGLRYVRSMPDLWVPLVMMAIIGTFAFNFPVVVPLFTKTTLHGTDSTFTVLFSIIGIGSLAGALFTARRTSTSVRDVVIGAGTFGISMLVFAASPNLASAVPISIVMGFTSILFMTASTAIVQMRAAPHMRGRVLALQAMVFLGSTPIGGPVLGAVCDAYGPRAGLALGGLACLVAAAYGHRATRGYESGTGGRPEPLLDGAATASTASA